MTRSRTLSTFSGLSTLTAGASNVAYGNATVNTFINATSISISNSTVNTTINASSLAAGNTTVNSVINATSIAIRNSTSNSVINASALVIGNSTVNTSISVANISIGNTTVNTQINATSLAINFTSNSLIINSTALLIGNSIYGSFANSSAIGINYGTNSFINSTALYVSNSVRANATHIIPGAIYANNSNGSSGQVLTSNGSGIYWSTVSGGGGSTLAIGNLVYMMWYKSSSSTYYLARGWVYKNNKATSPSSSTMYFRLYDIYTTSSINPSFTTVASAPISSWSFSALSSSYSVLAGNVQSQQLYGLEFYSGYNYAGSESIMPASVTGPTGATTLKYPSGGLSVHSSSVSGFNTISTDPTWGYTPNNYITTTYVLDGTQDSKIATFNYP